MIGRRKKKKKRRLSESIRFQVRVPKGARWSCRSCAACCRLLELGPVSSAVIHGLEAGGIENRWKPAAAAPWYETRVGPAGEELHFLAHRKGACVFLGEDNLCAVHRILGAEAKPGFCRQYPFRVIQDPKGSVLVVRAGCGGYHESFVDGAPVASHIGEVLDVLALGAAGPIDQFEATDVVVLPHLSVPIAEWMRWEETLLEQLRGPALPPHREVAALRDTLHRLAGREPVSSDPVRYSFALSTALEAIAFALDVVLSTRPRDEVGEHRAAVTRALAETVKRARKRADEDDSYLLSQQANEFFNLQLRSLVLAKHFQPVGGVPAGLGMHLFDVTLARSAQAHGATTLAALGPAYADWKRLTPHPVILQLLAKLHPALVEMFDHAGA